MLKSVVLALVMFGACYADLLPSWNEGAAKQAIVDFVQKTTDNNSPSFIPLEQRIATFDQDGTLWVEQPLYTQLIYVLDRIPFVVKEKPSTPS